MEVFEFEQNLKLESMAAMARVQDVEIHDEYVVQLAMMQDRLFVQFDIE